MNGLFVLLSLFVIVLTSTHAYQVKLMHKPMKTNTILFAEAQLGRVTMYKKEGCKHCKAAKELLEGKYELTINYVDIQNSDETKRQEILNQMRSFSGGRNTVPQIFFNSEHLGGNDDVQKLEKDGKLIEKIEILRKTPVTMMQDHWYHPWY